MTRFKDFGAGAKGTEKAEPLSFKLYDETFECVPQVQGKLLLELVADSSGEDAVKSASVIDKFFGYVLEDESLVRFNELIRDKHKIVTVETLADITGWLVEEYTNRPEEQAGA